MNSEATQEYNSFSLLANLEKNKVIYQALFTLVRHSSPLPTWALSFPPPLSETAATSTNKASNLHQVLPFLSCFLFLKKIYACVFIYLIEITIQREKFELLSKLKRYIGPDEIVARERNSRKGAISRFYCGWSI
jgi:hypothetical protein